MGASDRPKFPWYRFNEPVIKILAKSVREQYMGKMVEIVDCYIAHSDHYQPVLVLKMLGPDGIELKVDMPFFEDCDV